MAGMMWIVYFFLILLMLILSGHLHKKNKTKYTSICVVILIVLTCIFFGVQGENRWYEYHYVIKIEPTGLSSYELYFPVALDSKNQVHKIMDDIEVEGDAELVEIIDTYYGKALIVKGTGEIRIYAELVDAKTTFYGDKLSYSEPFRLSMLNHSTGGNDFHWVYLEIPERFSIDISVHAVVEKGSSDGKIISMPWQDTGGGPTYDIDTAVMDNGWHVVGAIVGERTVD